MSVNTIVREASEYVLRLMDENTKPAMYFHNRYHTQNVVYAVSEIARH